MLKTIIKAQSILTEESLSLKHSETQESHVKDGRPILAMVSWLYHFWVCGETGQHDGKVAGFTRKAEKLAGRARDNRCPVGNAPAPVRRETLNPN